MAVLRGVWEEWPFCYFLCASPRVVRGRGGTPRSSKCRPRRRTVRQIDTATAVNVVSGSCGLVKRALTR